jgi:LysM domain
VDPIVLVAIGFVVAVALAALLVVRARSRSTDGTDETSVAGQPPVASGPTVIQPSRIVVVGQPRPDPTTRAGDPGHRERSADPRRRIFRDAAAILAVGSLGVVALVNLPAVGGSSGAVLSATATPATAAAQPEPTAAPDPQASVPASRTPASAEAGGSGASPGSDSSAAPLPATLPARPVATPSTASLGLLEACPDRADCYVYVVRRGDNLTLISRLFGIPTATILRLNPTITDPSLIVTGDRLTIPAPTR